MSSPSPICTVSGSVTPVDVAANTSISGALASTAGANFWSVAAIGTDELNTAAAVNATLIINQGAKTFSFTSPTGPGSCVIFQSVVGINGLGLDANSVFNQAFVTTFKVNVKTVAGARVIGENETFEQSASAGWIAEINALIRTGTSIPTTVGSTGFAHVTAGAFDANARAVNLASNGAGGDVTGIVPWANGGRLQGILHVINGTPGVLSNVLQIAMCESNTGTTSVSIPTAAQFGGAIPDGFAFMVADTGGVGGTSAISITNAGSVGIVNPNTLTKVTAGFTLSADWSVGVWTWDATEAVFFLTSFPSVATSEAPAATSGGTLVMTEDTAPWVLFVAGDVITLPNPMVSGKEYAFTPDFQRSATTLETSPVTFQRPGGATYTFEDPQNRFAAPGTTATGRTSFVTYRFRYDGAGVVRNVN
jgi:hypothetical protein